VVTRAAAKLDAAITEEGAVEIAKRARGTPRVAVRLLRRVRDFAGDEAIDAKLADRALKRLEVDSDGLDMQDRRYLHALVETYSGGPVGVETLAAALAEARDALEDVIEPYLMQQGFVMRTPRGRMAAPKAYERLGKKAPPIAPTTGALFGEE
jgi:Holliday junction DNA helicase RuvB